MQQFYIYEHWRPDTGVCFYVGKGQGRRAYYFHRKRNTHYMGIAKKLSELGLCIDVRMIATGLSEDSAYALEKERIAFWIGAGVKLANQSPGGRGGMSGVPRSPESREKQSQTNTGRKLSDEHRAALVALNQSPEARARTAALHTGRKRPPETGLRIGAAHKKLWSDPEYRSKQIAVMAAGQPLNVSDETRAKQRAAKTPDARRKISEAAKRQWENPDFRKLVSDTMKKTNASRRK
jgi:hypothetical protein